MKTTKISDKRTKRRAGAMLPDDACPACGAPMKEKRGSLKFPVNGEEVTVTRASHLSCPKCGEIVLRLDEARLLREKAIEIYRHRYGLLEAAEIRAIRERLGLSQTDLADLLRLGKNTISRWESDRNVQSAAMDVLLRLLRDVPGNVEYLRKHAA